ncbi:MAG: RsmD family RNA methyltransferase [Bacteroidota bacterium]|nr:RsmD family RNA methyltransferase [Bacteroidota bacterium]
MSVSELSKAEKTFVQEHLQEDVSVLALTLGKYPHFNARQILRQVNGYQVMAQKVPSWFNCPDLLFPASLSLEQCSSELTAMYKAALVNRPEMGPIRRMADLTGGLGIDFSFMARHCDQAVYVERQEELCELALHNFQALGLTAVSVHPGNGPDVLTTLQEPFDLIFLDPARRDNKGSKVVALSDCEPDLTQIKSLLLSKAAFVLVKLSPMLDISLGLAQLAETVEVHVVAVDGECKELLFLMKGNDSSESSSADGLAKKTEPVIDCINLRSTAAGQSFSFTRSQEQQTVCRYAERPMAYLYEPMASILKGGAFSVLTHSFDVLKLHPNSHLYTSDQLIPDFPGRHFYVESCFPFHSKDLKTHLAGMTKANLTVRNFPVSVAEIRKKTGLKEGGDVYLFATTLHDGQKVLVKTRKPI